TDVDRLLPAFSIFCLSSHQEGLGTSLLDAMNFALPIVATAAGGIPAAGGGSGHGGGRHTGVGGGGRQRPPRPSPRSGSAGGVPGLAPPRRGAARGDGAG